MSFFSLFSNKVSRTTERLPEHSGLDGGGHTQPNSPGSGRKSMRLGQRELLYSVVRDVMVRAGVLVASYRFKVLSLDAQGRQYLIMMDLLKVGVGDMKRLAEIESMLIETAKARHDIVVTGIYWRNELQELSAVTPHTPDREAIADAAVPVSSAPSAAPVNKNLQRDETKASKYAVTSVDSKKSGQRKPVLSRQNQDSSPPEFEDTRIITRTEPGSPLSATQYGDVD